MAPLSLALVAKNYAYLAPLFLGDVQVEGVTLRFDRTPDAPQRTRDDPSVDVGEMSFSWYLRRLAANDCPFVGIPFFVLRSFRHRTFFVARGSRLRQLQDLEGRTVGTNGWANTGNTWSRAVLRAEGVRVERVLWCVGSIEGEPFSPPDTLPLHVRRAIPDRRLVDMLVAGGLDAILSSTPPVIYHAPESPVVRLLPDYRAAEQAYFRRTGIYPGTHIIGVRRAVFDAHPWVARRLYEAFERSKARWLDELRALPMTTPWLMADVEETQAVMGRDWNPSGVEPNRAMIRTACDELLAQGLIARPIEPDRVFAEFARAVNAAVPGERA